MAFIQQRQDALFLGRRAPAKATSPKAALDDTRKVLLADLATVPLLIIDGLGMRELPRTAAEDLLFTIHDAIALLDGGPANRF